MARNNREYPSLVGKRFGRLVVVALSDKQHRYNKRVWECLCDCGNTHYVATDVLNNGGSQSCGCLRKETSYKMGKRERLNRKPEGYSALNKLYTQYKRHARENNRVFELSIDVFKELTSSNCFYCVEPPSTVMYSKTYNGVYVYNGIDRVDNSKEYYRDWETDRKSVV